MADSRPNMAFATRIIFGKTYFRARINTIDRACTWAKAGGYAAYVKADPTNFPRNVLSHRVRGACIGRSIGRGWRGMAPRFARCCHGSNTNAVEHVQAAVFPRSAKRPYFVNTNPRTYIVPEGLPSLGPGIVHSPNP